MLSDPLAIRSNAFNPEFNVIDVSANDGFSAGPLHDKAPCGKTGPSDSVDTYRHNDVVVVPPRHGAEHTPAPTTVIVRDHSHVTDGRSWQDKDPSEFTAADWEAAFKDAPEYYANMYNDMKQAGHLSVDAQKHGPEIETKAAEAVKAESEYFSMRSALDGAQQSIFNNIMQHFTV